MSDIKQNQKYTFFFSPETTTTKRKLTDIWEKPRQILPEYKVTYKYVAIFSKSLANVELNAAETAKHAEVHDCTFTFR